MQLDYLTGIRGNGALTYAGPERLVRISRFDLSEAELLRKAVQELADGVRTVLRLNELPFVEGNGYTLDMRKGEEDEGLSTADERAFNLVLTGGAYARMLRAMAAYSEDGVHGGTWLTEPSGGIALLFSAGGSF
ncbi:hypothetical protein [Chitinophaga sp.]|uniref:hypothetical protein n=1 Tax=Chitinophaga sp. TaxID=1869181 RepID=UPI00260824FC|nr:hypothetical protein [uncultured Chitinophaga sp.]